MVKKLCFFCMVFICLLPKEAYSERIAPDKVEPVIYEGVRYEAPTTKMGYIEAYDVASGKKLWEKKIYDIKYNLFLERDVQDVFIKELKIEPQKGGIFLVATDELQRRHNIRIKERPQNILTEIVLHFSVDKEGGIYTCSMFNDKLFPPGEGYRYAEYVPAWLKRKDLKKLILIAERKYVFTPAFDQEFLTLLQEARENQKVVEMKRPCSDCKCKDGMTSVIYDYQDREVQMKTEKEIYTKGEKISFTIYNPSSFTRTLQVVSVEKLTDGKWTEVLWNAPCGCNPCDWVGQIDPDKKITNGWNQQIFDDGCKTASAGKYRFVIMDLSGYRDKEMCEGYDSVAYSNIFEIRE